MAGKEKKRRIISLENLDPAVKESLMKKYPSGFDPFIQKIQGLKGETLTIVPLETEDSIFMVKVKPEMKKMADDDDDDDTAEAAEIPETVESFGEEEEFDSKDDDDDGGFKDEPVEEYDDDDDDDEPADDGGADED